ncbi:MAG TPA: taurine catabolism dioxygenase TauD [Gammaproteobacteria bacterium]|nr:taurine catabolism dioxygenase TauD [Gammaproteobacteria bacterium]
MTSSVYTAAIAVANNPFDLNADAAYSAWRQGKLDSAPAGSGVFVLALDNAARLSTTERNAVFDRLERTNMVVYELKDPASQSKPLILQLGRQLGLERLDSNLCADEDGITTLRVVDKRREDEYVPYTNKRLNWHTDGYYNRPDEQIRGVILHCVQPADEGGENAFMDHEIAYLQLRDENPDYIRALMEADAMVVPANIQNGREIRPEQGGPVFSVDSGGKLHMRYSARARNIVWKNDPATQAAAECLLDLFQADSPYIFRHRLEAGQGVISNNALHCRTEFKHDSDADQGRLLYRARYFDRVANVDCDG